MQSALSVYMGSEAAKTIGDRGWLSAPFSTLIGASGGPKWLILSELDKVLKQHNLSTAKFDFSKVSSREAGASDARASAPAETASTNARTHMCAGAGFQSVLKDKSKSRMAQQ